MSVQSRTVPNMDDLTEPIPASEAGFGFWLVSLGGLCVSDAFAVAVLLLFSVWLSKNVP